MHEPDLNFTSEFDSFIDSIANETSTFVVRLTDGRPALVFRKTRDWDELAMVKDQVGKAIRSVQENTFPEAWRAFIGSDITPVGHAKWFSLHHVGYLKWIDCDEPGEETAAYRKVGDKWQEEVLIEAPSGELTFLKMSKKDPYAFQSLHHAFFSNVGVGWTSDDARYFRKADQAV